MILVVSNKQSFKKQPSKKQNKKRKIQLIMVINSKDSTKSNNVEIKMDNQTDEIIEELFESLLQKYQEILEEKMRGK